MSTWLGLCPDCWRLQDDFRGYIQSQTKWDSAAGQSTGLCQGNLSTKVVHFIIGFCS